MRMKFRKRLLVAKNNSTEKVVNIISIRGII